LTKANKNKPSPSPDGTTLLTTLFKDNKIYVTSIGDSQCLLCKAKKPVVLSTQHSPWLMEEKNRIEREGGTVTNGRVNGKLAVSRAIGDILFKDRETLGPKYVTPEPDVEIIDITPDMQFLILACDGLWDVVKNEVAINFVSRRLSESMHVETIVKELVNYAIEIGSKDNVSIILVRFSHHTGQ